MANPAAKNRFFHFRHAVQGKPLERGNPILNMRNQTFSRLCEIGYLGLYFGISHVSDHKVGPKMGKFDPKMGQTGSIFN